MENSRSQAGTLLDARARVRACVRACVCVCVVSFVLFLFIVHVSVNLNLQKRCTSFWERYQLETLFVAVCINWATNRLNYLIQGRYLSWFCFVGKVLTCEIGRFHWEVARVFLLVGLLGKLALRMRFTTRWKHSLGSGLSGPKSIVTCWSTWWVFEGSAEFTGSFRLSKRLVHLVV